MTVVHPAPPQRDLFAGIPRIIRRDATGEYVTIEGDDGATFRRPPTKRDLEWDARYRLGALPAGSQPISTSADAADRQTPDRLNERRRLVLAFFASRGNHGATADEVVAHFTDGHDVNSYAPRVTELLSMGLIVRTARKRLTRKGASAFVCIVARPAGEDAR